MIKNKITQVILILSLLNFLCGDTNTVSAAVNKPPMIYAFTANPVNINTGQSTTLSWSISGATNISIDRGVGTVTYLSSIVVAPSNNVTYTLTARNNYGVRTAQVSVTVSVLQDTTPPVISGIQAFDVTQTTATISWATNEPGDSQVEYGTTTSYGNVTILDPSQTLTHSAHLTALTAGTLYYYRVRSKDAAGNAAVSTGQTLTTQSASNVPPLSHSGWDYNLTKRCIKSPNGSASVNYYEDTTDCAEGPNAKNWTISNESEITAEGSCPGPVSQSFPINSAQSPLHLSWFDHMDESGRKNHTVRLLTDFNNFTHPCGAGHYTWFAFMDHANLHGGPLPRPDRAQVSADVYYNDYRPNAASRLTFGFQVFWNGKSTIIEVDPYTSSNWGDNEPGIPDILAISEYPQFKFILMDGPAMGITVVPGQSKTVTVPWGSIVQDLIRRGILTAPTNWNNTATQSTYIATEFRNDAPARAGSADLWFTNYRTEENAG